MDWSLLTSTGGMPSSHSAAVTSVATAVGIETGFDSPTFAVAAMLAGIVMYDASHVRFQAGQHAAVLNELRHDLRLFFDEIKRWPEMNEQEKIEDLKTLLGHKKVKYSSEDLQGLFLQLYGTPFKYYKIGGMLKAKPALTYLHIFCRQSAEVT